MSCPLFPLCVTRSIFGYGPHQTLSTHRKNPGREAHLPSSYHQRCSGEACQIRPFDVSVYSWVVARKTYPSICALIVHLQTVCTISECLARTPRRGDP